MTFSLLFRDPETGAMGGAAATGSLCVGGWVLRGDLGAGMSASQGSAPSTLWGQDVLTAMAGGQSAQAAVDAVTARDRGRDHRQLSAMDRFGATGAFTGADNIEAKGTVTFEGGIAAGNMLSGIHVLEALRDGFLGAEGKYGSRLLAALETAERAGGDFRGLKSAALLILRPDRPPLTLRVDYAEKPVEALAELYRRATSGDYADWTRQVPTQRDPERVLD